MQPTRFGRIRPPDEAWLAKQPPEPILEPELPIMFSSTARRAYRLD